MRRIVLAVLVVFLSASAFAQNDTTLTLKNRNVGVPRSNDHFMLQLGYTTWMNAPDSINTSGIPRTFNAYFLFDFPFKTNPHLSVAIGAGIASDNVYFEETRIGIADNTTDIRFNNVADTSHFKKYKLNTTYLEAPLELRFSSKPEDNRRSIKVALGIKVGTLLSAKTKGKNLLDKNDNNINSFTQKESSKKFFNQNRFSATGRIGYGHFSLFGSYQLNRLFKEGQGPDVRPLTVGLTLSGL